MFNDDEDSQDSRSVNGVPVHQCGLPEFRRLVVFALAASSLLLSLWRNTARYPRVVPQKYNPVDRQRAKTGKRQVVR